MTPEQQAMCHAVADAIEAAAPKRFNMDHFVSWASGRSPKEPCETAFCIAGWAMMEAGLYDETTGCFIGQNGEEPWPEEQARQLLGLSTAELFYCFDLKRPQAVRALRVLADEGEAAMRDVVPQLGGTL
jgi:hypothetical protein